MYRILTSLWPMAKTNRLITHSNNMKISHLVLIIALICLFQATGFSQSGKETASDSTLLGLPGDNLDLVAVLDLFQKSKTIEDFEKSLNEEKTGINNLDLNLDGKVDFIKVLTEQNKNDFTFILQVDVTEKEKQDVAVILLSKDDKGKVTMQIVGDKDLYGKDYVIEPEPAAPAVTANPGYTGDAPVETKAATTEVIVVESAPVVKYVYSPVYVPYYPPYYYGYYPPYFFGFSVMAVGIYHSNHYYHYHGYHGGYYGPHGGHNTVIIHNENNFNNYNNRRNTSNTVNNNMSKGSYGNRSTSGTRPSTGATAGTRPTTGAATKPTTGGTAGTRPSNTPTKGTTTSPSTRPSTGGGTSPSTRPATTPSTRPSTTPSTRPTTSPSATPSKSYSSPSSSSRGASSSYSRSSSAPRSGGGGYSGGARGGGGGGRRH